MHRRGFVVLLSLGILGWIGSVAALPIETGPLKWKKGCGPVLAKSATSATSVCIGYVRVKSEALTICALPADATMVNHQCASADANLCVSLGINPSEVDVTDMKRMQAGCRGAPPVNTPTAKPRKTGS